MSCKVVLVNPPQASRYPQPPMGLAILAAVLEREKHEVTVLDANALGLTTDQVVSRLSGADVVLLTAMTPTIGIASAMARRLKQSNPGLTIVLGGAHATLLPEETMTSIPDLDFLVAGEGEERVLDLLGAIEAGEAPLGIPGVTGRDNGRLVSTGPATTTVDLDSLPFLAYHLLPLAHYRPHPPHGRARPFAAVITSRGCPYRCAYCSKPVFRSKFRAQSAERVVEELTYYRDRFGVREIAFYDDVFTLDKKRVLAIAELMLKRGLKLHWTCETRVNLVDRELLLQMRRAGCYAISYGVESASPEVLQVIQKDISPDQVEEAVHITREAGIQSVGYFMIGSPGETPDTIRQTIAFSRKLRLDFAQFAVTVPFPGTKLYQLYLESGRDVVPWENFVYEGGANKTTPVFDNDQLSRSDLHAWAGKAYRQFYVRPGYVWQRLRRTTSLGDLRVNLAGMAMLLRTLLAAHKSR